MSERLMPRATFLALLALLPACAGRAPAAKAGIPGSATGVPRSGLEVIGAMRREHPSRALRSLSFTIRSTAYVRGPDSARVTISRGWISLPGRMRVDVVPASRRTGYVRNRQRICEQFGTVLRQLR